MTTGFSACKTELAALMDDVRRKVADAENLPAGERAAAVNVQADRFVDFKASSRAQNPLDPIEVDAIRQLDALAIDTAVSIQAAQVGAAVERIAARSAVLAAIGAKLEQHSLDNLSDAKRLRLTPIRDTVARMTDVVDTAKVLAKELEQQNPDEADIATAVAGLASQLETLRQALGAATAGG
jgi:hypothetical protein